MSVLIVIPTYNEIENIGRLLSEIFLILPNASVCVIDDNSPDGTGQMVEFLQSRFSGLRLMKREKKEGLGKAYIYAFNQLLANVSIKTIITMDADFSHNPGYLPKLIELRQKYDLVIGSRYIKKGKTLGWEMWRKFLSYFANLYCRLILRHRIHDSTSGFLAVNTDYLRKLDFSRLDFSGYAFTIGLKFLLLEQRATFKEVPIVFQNRTGGESKISNHIIKEGILAPWKLRLSKNS